jgi:hypothetical protein
MFQTCTPVFRWLIGLPLLLSLLLGALQPVAAQTTAPADTSRISYSEEIVDQIEQPVSAGSLGQAYSKLTRLQVEEQRLWKVGLNNFILTEPQYSLAYARYGLHLIYEQKLLPAWSVLGEISPDIVHYQKSLDAPKRVGFAVRTQVAGRYYYNLMPRIRKGKSASNFSANYLSLGLGAGFGRCSDEDPYRTTNIGRPVRLSAALLYGIQRRIGRYGFVDFNFGFPIPIVPERESSGLGLHISLITTLRIGLALGR